MERAVNIHEGDKGECCRVEGVLDGHCFRSGSAGHDDGRCAGIERGDDSCGREGGIDGGGEGEAQV